MILCCGEALIDMLPRQTVAGASSFQPYAGGAVFNTAIALARLGVDSGLYTGLSKDLFGAQLDATLRDSNVDTALATRSNKPTTLAFVELVDGQARYAFYDENTAGRMLSVDELPEIPAHVTAMFFGGISLVVEPCGSAYEALMLGAGAGRITMIDPNIRPGFIVDESAYRARLERMIEAADIVKLSDEDLVWLLGSGDVSTLAESLLKRGPRLVCITEGAKGAWAFVAGKKVFAPAVQVTPVDTVGAGDTFNAGILAGLSELGRLNDAGLNELDDANLLSILQLAVSAAAVTVSREGANPPMRSDLV